MLRTLIVDDEAPARERLRRLLQPHVIDGRVTISGEASDAFEALEALAETEVDLLLLDIQMPELDGFALVERLDPAHRPAIVFITAYNEYAIRAFDANAADYLLKPVSAERLEATLQKVERRLPRADDRVVLDARVEKLLEWLDAHPVPQRSTVSERPDGFLRQISIPLRDRILIVPVSRLVAAEVNEGITRLHITEENPQPGKPRLRQHIVSYTLDQLEECLDPAAFLRVHRSAIVHLDHVQEMIPWFSGRFKLMLTGGHELIASRERSRTLRERLLL